MEAPSADGSVSTPRLYAAAIAVVSGGYAVLAGTGGMATAAGRWVMLVVGLVALVHGVVLVTPAADRLGGWSGPLMMLYALVMLLNRAAFPMGATGGGGPRQMGGGMGFGMMDGVVGTMGGAGMVALAVLMLASGLIMTVRSDDGM